MKIVYLVQYFNLPSQNGSSRPYEMSRRLASFGHEVHVVTSNAGAEKFGPVWTTENVAGFVVHALPVPYANSMSIPSRLRAFVQFAVLSSGRARKLKGDVVLASSTPLTIAIPAVLATLFRSTPMVFEVRDLWPEVPIALGGLRSNISKWAAYLLQKIAYTSAAHIIALSPEMKKGIIAKGVADNRVSEIPNASDIAMFQDRGPGGSRWRKSQEWLGDDQLVLYCGTLGRVNDVGYIVGLAHRTLALDPTIKFLIVGDGAEKEKVRRKASRLGVLDINLFMRDGLPKEEVPDIFAAASLTMSTVAQIPVLYGNSANKLFDSFAAGKPIAINHVGWQADLLSETGAGIVLDGESLENAAELLVSFLSQPAQVARAGAAASRLAHTKYSRELLAEKLHHVLESTQQRT